MARREKGGNIPIYKKGKIGLPRRSPIKGPNVERWAAMGKAFEQMGKDMQAIEMAAYAMYMAGKGEKDTAADNIAGIEAMEGYHGEINEVDKQLTSEGFVGDAYLEERDNRIGPINEKYNATEFRTDKGRNKFQLRLATYTSNSNIAAIERAGELDLDKQVTDATTIADEGAVKAQRAPTYNDALQIVKMSHQPLDELAEKNPDRIDKTKLSQSLNRKIHAIQQYYAKQDMLKNPTQALDKQAVFSKYNQYTNEDFEKLKKEQVAAAKKDLISKSDLTYKISNEITQFVETGVYTNKAEILKKAAEHGPDVYRKTLAAFEIGEKSREAMNSFNKEGLHVALQPFNEQFDMADSFTPKAGDPDFAMKAGLRDNVKKVIEARRGAFIKDPSGYVTKFSIDPNGKALFDDPTSEQAIDYNIARQLEIGGIVPQATSVGWRKAWNERAEASSPEDRQHMVQALSHFGKYKNKVMDELELGAGSRLASDPYAPEDKTKDAMDLENAKLADLKSGLERPKEIEDDYMAAFGGSAIGKVMQDQMLRSSGSQAETMKRYKQMLEIGEKKAYKLAYTDRKNAGQGAVDWLGSIYGAIHEDDSISIFVPHNMTVAAKNELTDALEMYRDKVMPDHVKWVQNELNIEGMPDLGESETHSIQQAVWQNSKGLGSYMLVDEFGRPFRDQNGHQITVSADQVINYYRDEMKARKKKSRKIGKGAEDLEFDF